MTKRTTSGELLRLADFINKYAKDHGAKWYITVEWAYGQPRAYLYNHNGDMLSELSPRLSTGEMKRWLYAFLKGLEMGASLSANAE